MKSTIFITPTTNIKDQRVTDETKIEKRTYDSYMDIFTFYNQRYRQKRRSNLMDVSLYTDVIIEGEISYKILRMISNSSENETTGQKQDCIKQSSGELFIGRIIWKEQNEWFGLDYSTKKGEFKDYTFDIRYDYAGDPKIKPTCGCSLSISFKGQRIYASFGSIDNLTNLSEQYLNDELNKLKEYGVTYKLPSNQDLLDRYQLLRETKGLVEAIPAFARWVLTFYSANEEYKPYLKELLNDFLTIPENNIKAHIKQWMAEHFTS